LLRDLEKQQESWPFLTPVVKKQVWFFYWGTVTGREDLVLRHLLCCTGSILLSNNKETYGFPNN
jgi:hypothetical protein